MSDTLSKQVRLQQLPELQESKFRITWVGGEVDCAMDVVQRRRISQQIERQSYCGAWAINHIYWLWFVFRTLHSKKTLEVAEINKSSPPSRSANAIP